jgi:hypothetical protein
METTKIRKKRTYPESELQRACLLWLQLQFPEVRKLVIKIDNENKVSAFVGSLKKKEGLNTGAADIFIATPKFYYCKDVNCLECLCLNLCFHRVFGYHGLFIEFKAKGKLKNQTEKQKEFQFLVEKQGYKYALIDDFGNFEKLINEYCK